MTDPEKKQHKKKKTQKEKLFSNKGSSSLTCERLGSQVLSSQPPSSVRETEPETARETERLDSHVDPLCACVDFPNREAETDGHVCISE